MPPTSILAVLVLVLISSLSLIRSRPRCFLRLIPSIIPLLFIRIAVGILIIQNSSARRDHVSFSAQSFPPITSQLIPLTDLAFLPLNLRFCLVELLNQMSLRQSGGRMTMSDESVGSSDA